MRAVLLGIAYGGPDRLEMRDVPRPTPGAGELLIRVVCGSVNPVDWKLASGKMRFIMPDLGANEVIDYAKPDAYRGQPAPGNIFRALFNRFTSKQVRAIMLKSTAADLQILDQLAVAGKLRVVVDSRYPLEALGAAWEPSISGRSTGKIIVDVATA